MVNASRGSIRGGGWVPLSLPWPQLFRLFELRCGTFHDAFVDALMEWDPSEDPSSEVLALDAKRAQLR